MANYKAQMIYSSLIVALLFYLCAADQLINPKDIPLGICSPVSSCWHYESPPDEICPVDLSKCPNDDPSCGMYHSDCYCKLKTGLSCAWVCGWWEWMQIEDWFFKQCPDAPTVEFSKAPTCVATCLAEKSIDYGCLTKNTNCFCIHGSLFDCQQWCGDQDKQKLKGWLMDTCGIDESLAAAGVESGDFTVASSANTGREAILTSRRRRKLRWYEIMVIALLSISFVAAVALWGWVRWTNAGGKIRTALPRDVKVQ
ncbi:hypothetical protein BU24DRAFT_428608 [Aaosphaeria arxii CBS 175.79]|uniref:Extracellular membrane protein CFEM domain-containing protein n=1 Tax=Aaosphaeria arxii CBS 175.79 TaxID=1450172 RepID=A0A6A5X9Y5_9PLEO|nr:uncharacterized protein BU24DRAFT_428608 [Aaosphaeria arxii CBS 175.79]KAF2009719.1 hypothetical protein BU24DRAFT_428608 [Aaosphaeria arxii CBS 175.79]